MTLSFLAVIFILVLFIITVSIIMLDIKTVSGMLGHFSAGFTLDTYAHVTTTAQKEAAQTMGNILSM